MRRAPLQLFCQIYMALVLLATASIITEEGLLYTILALVLALTIIFFIFRPQPPRYNIVLNLAMIFLAPLMLATPLENMTDLPPLAIQFITLALTLPAFYQLDYNLRENARQAEPLSKIKGERHITGIFISLLILTLVIMLIAPVVNEPGLIFTGIAFLVYLLGILVWLLTNIPRPAFTINAAFKRIIAGTTGNIPLELTSQAAVSLYGHFNSPVSWLQIAPQQSILKKGNTNLTLNFTPRLAGQSRPQLQVSAIDPRGLIQINELLEPVSLHVIPRAQYAEWLARKYLEQTYSGAIPPKAITSKATKPKRGTEYYESRTYRPGDILRDIDWKHTLKLSQLIVREYQEAGEQAAIIAVNLAVTDEEARDQLAFNLLTVALTLARENIPAALAAYNHQAVVYSTSVIDYLDILERTLSLINEITIVKFTGRLLEPIDIAKIRRNIKQLQQIKTEPAQRLLDILTFEHSSIEEVARNHPATRALIGTVKSVPAPAMIFLISQFNHDTEAILVTAEKLARRNFNILPIETA